MHLLLQETKIAPKANLIQQPVVPRRVYLTRSRTKRIMEEQEQVQNLQGQVSELREQISKLMRMMREMSQNKKTTWPASEPNLPIILPLTITIDAHAQKLHNQASNFFTFQTRIPDPTITFNPAFPTSELPVSYHQAVPNVEFHPSALIPSVYPTTNFPSGGIAHEKGGENRKKEN